MTQPTRRGSGSKRTVSISVILGTLLVPLSAVAAMVLTDPSDPAPQSAPELTSTTQAATTSSAASEVAFDVPVATQADLEMACGPAGMELVAFEVDGTITEIQQAALDALRAICEQEGTPLPGKPQPSPIVETVVVSSGTAPETTAPSVQNVDDPTAYEHEDDEREHEDDEREHQDEEHEDHEDHEDEHEAGGD